MFHIQPVPLSTQDYATSDAIKTMVLTRANYPVFLATEEYPPDKAGQVGWGDVPTSRWCKILRPRNSDGSRRWGGASNYENGMIMADECISWLNGSRSRVPARVMIDELTDEKREDIQGFADRMWLHQHATPQAYALLLGKWGVFVGGTSGVSFPNWETELRKLMASRAIITVEFYARYADYWNSGGSSAARDSWLSNAFFFKSDTRFPWLWGLAGQYQNPAQPITVMFGVTDWYATKTGQSGGSPSVFLDRMFFVWMGRPEFRGVLAAANGGAGAWKWQSPGYPGTSGTINFVGNTSRDAAFVASWEHYCLNGSTSSRLGVVP